MWEFFVQLLAEGELTAGVLSMQLYVHSANHQQFMTT